MFPGTKDYFKIVAVIKKKRVEYSFVPHKWEKDNILYWPQANIRALRSDPSSHPEADWTEFPCKVKKSAIFGREEAELWEEQFLAGASTDTEDNMTITTSSVTKDKNSKSDSFDAQFENIDRGIDTEPVMVYENLGSDLAEISPELNQFETVMLDTFQETSENNESITESLEKIQKNQKQIIQNQEKILQGLDSEFTQQKGTYDRIYKILNDRNLDQNLIEKEPQTAQIFINFFKFPLVSVEDVFAFNKEIGSNSEYRKYLISTHSAIGGTDGNEEGKIVSKKLRVIFFSEHVLTLFSWTGISRTAGLERKESFQMCEHLISLFLELITLADSRWNASKNEKFFKYNSLKHAKQIEKASEKKKKLEKKSDQDEIVVEAVNEIVVEAVNERVELVEVHMPVGDDINNEVHEIK